MEDSRSRTLLGAVRGGVRTLTLLAVSVAAIAPSLWAQMATSLPAPPHQRRPAWWREEGVVIAGAWEPLAPRLRGSGLGDYDAKMSAWRREHSEETARRLKELGCTLVIIPLYKGAGLKTERISLEDAKRFTEICHRVGLRVGVYAFSGTVLYESIQAENPLARDWFIQDQNGRYITYSYGTNNRYYRRWANRSHPGVRAMMRELVRYAIEEVKADLIHFDNYTVAPGYEPYSVQRFREFLKSKYTPEERMRRFGFSVMDFIEPPPAPRRLDGYNRDPLFQDFMDYRCQMQTDTYHELAEYARSLNPDVVMECNPEGYYGRLSAGGGIHIGAVDHTRLLEWGGAFWDEGFPSRLLENGVMHSRFRSHMLGRQFNNMVFQYTPERVAMAESMANNLQCLGAPISYAGGEIGRNAARPASPRLDPRVLDYIRFFHREQRYFRDAELIADVGVLNTYANTAYGPSIARSRMAAFEQALYQGKVPFTLVPGRYPGNLDRFRVLVLADLALIPDKLVRAVRDFVERGGGVVLTGLATLFDENGQLRERVGLADLFGQPLGDVVLRVRSGKGRAVYIPRVDIPEKFEMGMLPANRSELLEAVRWAADRPLQVEVKANERVAMSLYHQPNGRRLLHLVNYDDTRPVSRLDVTMQLPPAQTTAKVTLLSPDFDTRETIRSEREGSELRFSVPRLEAYDLLVIE